MTVEWTDGTNRTVLVQWTPDTPDKPAHIETYVDGELVSSNTDSGYVSDGPKMRFVEDTRHDAWGNLTPGSGTRSGLVRELLRRNGTVNDTQRSEIRKRLEGLSPLPWAYNGYNAISSVPGIAREESFWTEDRFADGHTYDNRVGEICPGCGERPCIINGVRHGNYWDCERWTDAYNADGLVASVPAHHGDTAIGARCNDAELIANAPSDIAALLEENDQLRAIVLKLANSYKADVADGQEACLVCAMRVPYHVETCSVFRAVQYAESQEQ